MRISPLEPCRRTKASPDPCPLTHLRAGDGRRLRCSSRFAIDRGLGGTRARRLDLRSLLARLHRRRTVPIDLSLPLLEQIYSGKLAVAIFNPRGLGPTASALAPADQNEVRRRYLLLGQTVDGMRVWDIRRAVAALRSPDLFGDTPIVLVGHRDQAVNAAYASLWIDALAGLELVAPPATHAKGPDYLNVLRFLDVPQAVALAAERHPVVLRDVNRDDWSWTARTAAALKWPADRLQW